MDTTADTDEGVQDEISVLDQLESDLAAVEQAIERLDHITAEDVEGEIAASRIDAAVSAERFGPAPLEQPGPSDRPGPSDQPARTAQPGEQISAAPAGSAEVADDTSPTPFG